MKKFIFLMAISIECAAGGSTDWNEESRRKESDQTALWELKLVEAQRKPPNARVEDLWLGLRNMGYRRTLEGHSSAVDEAYQKIQQELLSIPGHAQYFADELERLSIDPKSDYLRIRATYLAETLQHLPSPETIQVLGHYLSDMRDTPYDENPKYIEALRAGKVKEPDWTPTPQNAWLATYTLSNIGLNSPPFEPVGNYVNIRFSEADSLPKFREWWEDVKSGKRTFSFVGQTVEYRFKPDGGWETVTIATPPDDRPKVDEHSGRERKLRSEPLVESPLQVKLTEEFRWLLPFAGFVVAVLGGIWASLACKRR